MSKTTVTRYLVRCYGLRGTCELEAIDEEHALQLFARYEKRCISAEVICETIFTYRSIVVMSDER